MFRLNSHAAVFALVIGLLTTFTQTARAGSWSWENLFSFGSSANAAAVCTTDPVVAGVLDSGPGSLRQAVIDACAGSIITFSASMPPEVLLTTGQIVIDKNLTIQGPGADRLTVRNGASSRIFQVNTGVTATISGLTIEDGTNGGISNAGTVTVADCVIRGNKGSGIQNSGNLTVVNSVLSDNEAEAGGAINNTNTAAITNSTILHNSAKAGGGIYNQGSMTITNSSITGNTATGRIPFVPVPVNGNVDPTIFGSAILNRNGRATITNSTIAGNNDEGFASRNCYIGYPTHTCPAGYGTAILIVIDATGAQPVELNLINSTVTDNILRKLFINRPYSVTARNSIINGFADGELTSQGYNLIVNTFAMSLGGDTTGNILNVNPHLGPLGYHGGSTMTHALLTGSPAINAGNTATSPAADQRGASRVGAADIGAFELNNSANGGNFVVQLPDAFTEIAYSHLLVEDGGGSFGGALPTGFSLSTTESSRVLVSGRTAQTGVFAFSFTATDYRLRVLPSDAPPFGGCLSSVVVANKSDAGEGTLRQAVIDACAGGTISFGEAARGKIHLTGGPIAINKNLTIAGPGADALTLRSAVRSGPQNNVVLVNFGVTAVISGLTVSDGFADFGGGIRNEGNLTVRNVVLSNNHGVYSGGGIGNYGTLTLDKSLVTGNGKPDYYAYDRLVFVTDGGGIHSVYNNASLTITDSTVSGNNASQGGGIYVASATITNSTISDNRITNSVISGAGLGGGFFLDFDGMATLTNCTVSQNIGNSEGGGIYNNGGTLSLINTTVANNEIRGDELNLLHGAGIAMFAAGAIGTVNARNSIIARNKTSWVTSNGFPASSSTIKQFYGTLTSQGYNLIGNTGEGQITGVTTGNIVADPRLSPLGYYGGPTQTQSLLTGSLAINAGSNALAIDKDGIPLTTDQRGTGFPRIVGASVDIGAFEFDDSTPTPTPTPTATPTPTVTPTPTPTATPTPSPTPTPNTPPNAAADVYSVNEDATLTTPALGVLGNDMDAEINPLTATLVTNAANGSATLNADGSFSYTPNTNFNGSDSFTYTASDGSLSSNAATVTITVNSVNDNPDAINDSGTVAEDSGANTVNVRGNDSISPDTGETLTISFVTQGTNGAVAITGGGTDVSYTPNANFNGADSFTYTISDGNGGSDPATVNITVTSVNDAPDAVNDSATVDEDSGANAVSVFTNDSILPDTGETLSITAKTNGANGTVAITGGGTGLTYTPNAGFNGSDSFTYTVSDGNGGTDTATVSVTVTAVNDAPVLDAIGNKTTNEGNALTFTATGNDNADAPNPNNLSFSLIGAPAGATITAAGAFSWTPTEAQGPGTFTFRVRVTDNGTPNLFDEEEITVTVREVNAAPVLGAIGNRSGFWGNVQSFTAAATDSDFPANTLTYTLTGAPTGASITAAGAFTWTPGSAQLGTYTFTVVVTDNGTPLLSDSETITITIGKRPTMLVYSGAAAGQYSDSATLIATLADNGGGAMQGSAIVGKTINFTLGTQLASELTNASGVAGKSLTLTQMAQALNILSQFGGNSLYLSSGDSDPFTINKEDVETAYTGDSVIFTAGPNIGTASSVRLAARLTQLDNELGDLTLARVRFELYKFSNSSTTPTFIYSNIAVDAAGNAETTVALAVDDAYTVRVVIETLNGYWLANPAGEGTLVVAYGTTERRVTGGGWVPDTAAANNKSHFGFTVAYSKNGSPRGNALYLFRGTDGFNYRVKSNSWQGGGLTFYGDPWKAAFSGKCNVQKIDPLTGLTVQSWGGYSFIVDLVDGDLKNPRETDRYAIQILTDTGAIWKQIGTRTLPVQLGGGNVAVNSK